MPLRPTTLLCLLGLAFAGSAAPAYAYLDPGTGSMILQLLLGGFAGLALAGKLYWRRFLVMIGARTDDDDQPEQPKTQADR